MVLRYYQQNAINDITDFFKSGGLHCILQAPTGSGKTIIFTHLAKLVSNKGNKILILTDRIELLYQAGGSLKKTGLNSMYIQAGQKTVSNAFNCYVGMSQTLRKRIKQPIKPGIDDPNYNLLINAYIKQLGIFEYWIEFFKTIDLLIIDECHLQQFNWILESGLFDKKHVIGFTATPKRTGKMRQLALDYETIIEGISIKELIKQGFLVNDDHYDFGAPDLSDVEFDHKKGDYKDSSLFKKFNSPSTYSGAVKNYQEITPNTKAICFCVNIEHCIRTAIAFNKAGISAKFIVSKLSMPKKPKDEENAGQIARYEERKRVYELLRANKHLTGNRKDIFKDFKNDEFKILINTGIATTGYDEPTIETEIELYATLSTTKVMQTRGRASRISPGKTHFNILDFGGNAERLGGYSEDRIWNLWHEESKGEGLPPIKTCGIDANGKPISDKKGCNRPILASYKICPFCGFKYPEKKHKEVVLELTMPISETNHKAVKAKKLKDMTNLELHNYWKNKGHKPPWIWRQLWYRGGKESIEKFGKEFGWKSATIEIAIEFMN